MFALNQMKQAVIYTVRGQTARSPGEPAWRAFFCFDVAPVADQGFRQRGDSGRKHSTRGRQNRKPAEIRLEKVADLFPLLQTFYWFAYTYYSFLQSRKRKWYAYLWDSDALVRSLATSLLVFRLT